MYKHLIILLEESPQEYLKLPRLRVLMLLRRATMLHVNNSVITDELLEAGSLTGLLADAHGAQSMSCG